MSWYFLALISALFIGLYEIAEKRALIKEHSYDFLAAVSFLMLIMSIPFLWLGNIKIVDSFDLLLVFIDCIFTVSLYIFAARALKHLDISEYSPLMNLSPLFLIIISWLFLSEMPKIINLFGIFLIVSGAYFLEIEHHDWLGPLKRAKSNKYIHFIFLGIVFAGMSALMDKVILTRDVNVDTFYFYKRMFTAILLALISTFLFNGYRDVVKVYKRSFIWVFSAGLFYMSADYIYFTAAAMPTALISLIIPAKRLSAIVSTVFGGKSFGEKHLTHKAIAALIMITGVFFIVL